MVGEIANLPSSLKNDIIQVIKIIWDKYNIRAVTHKNITEEDINSAGKILNELFFRKKYTGKNNEAIY